MGFAKLTLANETADGHFIILLEPLIYTTDAGEIITAPIGTRSDGASTPRVLWPVIPPFGSYWLATVLHDYLYRITNRERDFCDNTLLEAMVSLNVELVLREAIYEGVRLGGSIPFNDDRRIKLRTYQLHLATLAQQNFGGHSSN